MPAAPIYLHMEPLSEESVFAAWRVLLLEEGRISLGISSDGIEIRFPATRRIAAYLDVPHYYVLPYFASMEAGVLLNSVERVGISTTYAGSKNCCRKCPQKKQNWLKPYLAGTSCLLSLEQP